METINRFFVLHNYSWYKNLIVPHYILDLFPLHFLNFAGRDLNTVTMATLYLTSKMCLLPFELKNIVVCKLQDIENVPLYRTTHSTHC